MRSTPNSAPQKHLQDLLKAARENASLTQEQLARAVGKPQSFVAKFENGERKLNVIELILVLRALGVAPGRFVDDLNRGIENH